MSRYDQAAQDSSYRLIRSFSTSFSSGTRLFRKDIRRHIANIYGFLRVADEIVDTYDGPDKATILEEFKNQTYASIQQQFSPNPALHAFQITARQFNINHELIDPFLASMASDISVPKKLSKKQYNDYIYGSAEVVGLMCLRIFVEGNDSEYKKLQAGAGALGAAFQKINFLRDMAEDNNLLGRYYFPIDSFESFTNKTKFAVIEDIEKDLTIAEPAIDQLPSSAKTGVLLAHALYTALLDKLKSTDAAILKHQRIRIPNKQKARIAARVIRQEKLRLPSTIQR
ncbi:TPA: phytoene/squalene synthase family protein [Candidatus Saccharibacteria bacterium]|nr:phytoene/squalene synthase family protein [Candidatus Saccharibacteria bacterium]HIO87285.1 phytoene/squalene synthase family protein [Candidatus Saccharibacteria bacterium]